MANLCIIPARGGSKRIPNKNIKEFHGKPMINYPIQTAMQSGIFDEIMVSTDSEEIAEVSLSFGASVPFLRSSETSNDFATTADVVLEVLKTYGTRQQHFSHVCCLYPCTPLLTPDKLVLGYEILLEGNVDAVFSITKFDFPIQRAFQVTQNQIAFLQKEFALTRTQDLEPFFHDAGQFYWLNSRTFLEKPSIMQEKTGFVMLESLECQDIDYPEDWHLASCKYMLKNNKS